MIIRFVNTLSLIIASTWFAACAHAAVASSGLEELPLEARQSVLKWNFKFKTFAMGDFSPEVQELFSSDLKREAPMKMVGDFNGDKVDDYALLGEVDKQQFLITVLSGKKDWQVVQVQKWSDPTFKKSSVPGVKSSAVGVPVYLARAAGPLPESYAKQNKREAIQLEAYLGAVQLFKIENGKAEELKP